jgi:hypothetical protein
MRLEPGLAYKLTHEAAFAYWDGIYVTKTIHTYADIVEEGIDLYALTYEPAGVDKTTYNSYLPTIRDGEIWEVTHVETEEVAYLMPHMLSLVPDVYVERYGKYAVAANLGYNHNPDLLETIRDEIQQLIESMLGVTGDVVVYEQSHKWMTQAEYDAIQASYQANITNSSNCYADRAALEKEVLSLKTKLNYYEELIIATQP